MVGSSWPSRWDVVVLAVESGTIAGHRSELAIPPLLHSNGAGRVAGLFALRRTREPAVSDAVGGRLAVGVADDSCGERGGGVEVAEAQLVVEVAVLDDVGVVGVAAAGHADVEAGRLGAWADDGVRGVGGAALCAGDGDGVERSRV
jgi:hypothetical protein